MISRVRGQPSGVMQSRDLLEGCPSYLFQFSDGAIFLLVYFLFLCLSLYKVVAILALSSIQFVNLSKKE